MPLRDHFRPPLDDITSWTHLHAGWPMVIVQHLRRRLPAGYIAAPIAHTGTVAAVDVAAFETIANAAAGVSVGDNVALWTPTEPTLVIDRELPEFDEFEVQVFDVRRNRRLVAAIEIVSPANKDRPESRRDFVAKCAALLQQGVSLVIVDLVTVPTANLYAELLDWLGEPDPALGDDPPATYAVSCRRRTHDDRERFEAWSQVLPLGAPLPTLPLWLADSLPLEETYEAACEDLSIP